MRFTVNSITRAWHIRMFLHNYCGCARLPSQEALGVHEYGSTFVPAAIAHIVHKLKALSRSLPRS